jgi:hypothetical protein
MLHLERGGATHTYTHTHTIMAPKSKTGGSGGGGGGGKSGRGGRTLKDGHPLMFAAVEKFIHEHSNFESSVAAQTCIAALGEATTLNEAFEVPLKQKLLSMEGALYWVLFLSAGPDRAEADGDPAPSEAFSSREALALIAKVYDNGLQNHVLEHFDPDDEEVSSSGEEEDQ